MEADRFAAPSSKTLIVTPLEGLTALKWIVLGEGEIRG